MGKGRAKRRKRGKRCRPMKRHSLASDPEGDGSDRERRNFLELGWDSWDESTTVSHPHPHGRTCSHTNESRLEEAEITRKFSTLNFSVLPCDALCGGDSTVHQQQLVSGVGESEIEVFSELPSASQLDAMPGLALDARRQGRKRSSRRRVNRKQKKARSAAACCLAVDQRGEGGKGGGGCYNSCSTAKTEPHPHYSHSAVAFVKEDTNLEFVESLGAPSDDDSTSRSPPPLSPPLVACDGGGMVVGMAMGGVELVMGECDREGGGRGGISVGAGEEWKGTVVTSRHSHAHTSAPRPHHRHQLLSPMATSSFHSNSDLSEPTTTDSGCDGDDEESSAEFFPPSSFSSSLPSSTLTSSLHSHSHCHQHKHLGSGMGPDGIPPCVGTGWWERDIADPTTMTTTTTVHMYSEDETDEERFSQIMSGVFPLMSREGQKTVAHLHAQQQQQRSSISPEFKHPGRYGVQRGSRSKRHKQQQRQVTSALLPCDVNEKIAAFVESASDKELCLPLVSRALCRTIANLASVYNLHCVMSARQKRRLPVASPLLRKTLFTRMASKAEVDAVLQGHGRDSPLAFINYKQKQQQLLHLSHPGSLPSSPSSPLPSPGTLLPSPPLPPPPPPPLQVVGGEAKPLDDSNVGNRMLQGMGWRPGTGLGIGGHGMQEPVVAKMRGYRNAGLGYS